MSVIQNLLTKNSPFADPELFFPGNELLSMFTESCRVLVIGAGGLGCEILKDLAYSGFRCIDVIDNDHIELTNLNRQFLFREKDIGKPKAVVAAAVVSERKPDVKITPHVCKIQELPIEFYAQFPVIITGLDNIEARRWINSVVHNLVEFDQFGNPKLETCRFLVDGGTEGFRGQARVIHPFKTACFECTLDTLPPQTKFQICTIASNPRLPEHCIEYVYLFEWEKAHNEIRFDDENEENVQWMLEKSLEYAYKHKIEGVTRELVLGVVKNIIPAVASTNAIIAAACVSEAFKIMTGCGPILQNNFMFMGQTGIYCQTFAYEKNPECEICSRNLSRSTN